ncbi:MAG TPA: hypothetical protein VLG09_04325 [Candidatus Saccharimonadales bacterium]|nr:hypothetical protein [Candidatus Saccharimonadales bacterium]
MGFDPVTLTLGMMAGGSLLKAGGDIFTGINKSNMDKYQAGWAQKQAAMEQQNAAYARSVGEVKAQRVGEAAAQDYGKAVATEASSGFKVGSGTYGDVNAAIRRRGQFDEATTRQNAAREAYGYEVKSAEDTVKAGMYKTAAKTDMISGFIGGASSILGGGTQVADKWVQFGQAGLIV